MYEQITLAPGWVTRTALIAAAIVIVVPLLVLAFAGLLIGAVVFVALGLIARIVAIARALAGKMSGRGPDDAGRRNVRVIRSLVIALLLVLTASAHAASAGRNKSKYNVDTPQWNALESPRETMFTFLENANYLLEGKEGARPRVSKTLDMSKSGNQDLVILTEQLLGILNRLGEVKPQDIPDQKTIATTGIRRFTYFPRGTKHDWVWKDLGHAPEGSIVLVVDEQGLWRFSADTVAGLPVLYGSMKDLPPTFTPASEGGDLKSIVGPTFEKTSWWGWASLLIAIFIGLVLGKVAQFICRGLGSKLENRQWSMRASVFNNMASPASLAMLTFALLVGLGFIYMDSGVRDFSNQVVKFLMILSVGWYMYNLVDAVDLLLRRVTDKTENKIDDMIVPLVRKTLRIFLVIVFTLLVAQNVFGLNITSWLAGLGIAGLAVSLAAQDSVKNLFGSITIFFDKPFLVEDFIAFDGFTGTVEEIGFRSTRLRLLSGHLVTIPNMKFIDGNVENISKRPYIRRQMDVTITYDTPPEKIDEAIDILRDLLNSQEVVEEGRFNMEDNPPRIAFNELNADSLNIRAYYWYQMDNDPDRGFFSFIEHAQIVNMKLFKAYGDAGIEFAFPTQTLYIAGDPARQLTVKVDNPQ